jgi:hypothetical protein
VSDSVNLWGLPLHEWAAGGCEVAAIFLGALLVSLAVLALAVRFLR